MTDKPKRPLWQLHLSPAVVLLISIGALMWLDFAIVRFLGGEFKDNMSVRLWDLALINGFCLFCVGLSFERFIRRREAKKP